MRLKSSLFSLLAVLLFSALWSVPALADSVTTDRGCGSSTVYFTGETASITIVVTWAYWFQNWALTVSDAQGDAVFQASGSLLPLFIRHPPDVLRELEFQQAPWSLARRVACQLGLRQRPTYVCVHRG